MKIRMQRIAVVIISVILVGGMIPNTASYARPRTFQEEGVLSLPDGKMGQTYEYQLRTEGGLEPLNWKVVSGDLPPGLSFEPSGKVKGTPSSPRREAYSFVVEVSDSSHPSQRVEQPCLLRIEAAPLRVLGGTRQLRVVQPAPGAKDSSKTPSTPGAKNLVSEPHMSDVGDGAARQARGLSWPAVDPEPAINEKTSMSYRFADSKESSGEVDELNPAHFVKIYEVPKAASMKVQTARDAEIYGKLIYDHSSPKSSLRSTRLTADENSSLAIFPDTTGRNIAFNTIYMAAELSSADTKQNLEVMNYSEVGTAPAGDALIIGASFETARNIIDKLITLQRRSTDILKYVLKIQPKVEIKPEELDRLIEIDAQTDADDLRKRARVAFDQYTPEIESISSFLLTETNRNIVERVANNVFNLDRDTLVAIAKQFSTDAALSHLDNAATRRLLWRTVQVYKDFQSARAEILRLAKNGGQPKDGQGAERTRLVTLLNELVGKDENAAAAVARDLYAYDRSDEVISNLRQTKFPVGWVSLDEARAKDGDTLKLTVRVQNPAGAGTGNKVPFYIAVKRYGVKLHWASSFMFLKRMDITAADLVPDANGKALTDVNFAPSPGVSYGFTYFKRGDSGGSKFIRTLAPTVGINVSFMNFKDPGFDLKTGMFTNTKGTDVQVGTGPIFSLFNNKLHFIPIGWNLNVDRKRRYWGIGFGFVEFAKELGKYLKSS